MKQQRPNYGAKGSRLLNTTGLSGKSLEASRYEAGAFIKAALAEWPLLRPVIRTRTGWAQFAKGLLGGHKERLKNRNPLTHKEKKIGQMAFWFLKNEESK